MALSELFVPRSYLEANGNGLAKARDTLETSEIGSTGLQHYGGVLNEELLPSLQGDRALRVYVEMLDNDPIIGGLDQAIDNLIRRVSWEFEPADDSAEARRWAEHCQSCLDDMSSSWADTTSSIFSFAPMGWSFHEVIFKRRNGPQDQGNNDPDAPASSKYDDGLVGWRKWPIRAQETRVRWELDDHGGVQGMWQNVNGAEIRFIPIRRGLLFRAGSRKDSPEPKGYLRNAYRPHWFKRRFEELEGVGIERDLAGLPIASVPAELLTGTATVEQRRTVDAIRTIVTNIRRNSEEGVVWPLAYDDDHNQLYKLELLSSSGKRQLDINQAVTRKNMEIAICALADWLLLGHEAVGSKALGTTKVDMFTTACETWTQGAADVVNSHAVPKLLALNGVAPDLSPRLRPGRVSQVDIQMFAESIGTLISKGGMVLDDVLEDWVRATIGAPARVDAAVP